MEEIYIKNVELLYHWRQSKNPSRTDKLILMNLLKDDIEPCRHEKIGPHTGGAWQHW